MSPASSSTTQAVLLLRWVLIIATSYLVVFSHPLAQNSGAVGLFVAAYFASNVILTELLPRFRSAYRFDVCVVLVDTAMVSIGLALTGATSSEFYVVYFIVMFLCALTERLGLVVVAATLISAAQLYTEARFLGLQHLMTPAYMLRVPFLFVVAMFFGNLVRDARRREHEEEESRARERRMQLLSGISHDLKNPLGVIQSLGALLLDGDAGPLNEQQTDLVRRIHASTRHVITMALNLIDAARIEAGRMTLQRQPVRLEELVEDALLLACSASDLKGVTLESTVDPDVPTVQLDAVQMERVISNIVGNAIKFTPPGGTVSLGVHRAGREILLVVRDSGSGIDPAELANVFEQYRRRAASGVVGSGLGLFIVKAIVEAHGGTVTVDSVIGTGTTVTVRLPADAPLLVQHVSRRERRRARRRSNSTLPSPLPGDVSFEVPTRR